MTSWPMLEFGVAVEDVTGGNIRTLQSDYLVQGNYPIVDQGQQQVAGYTNDSHRLVRSTGPLIVFGDHTTCIKFFDERFALGADGVKVLRPKTGFDAKFLYHFLSTRRLPNAGYSRHFKFLKQIPVPSPPIAEQRRIADVLDRADALRAERRAALTLLDDLNESIFLEMFGDLHENPAGFELRHLDEWLLPDRPMTYGILMPGPDIPDGVPYVRVVDMRDGGIAITGVRRTTSEISQQYRRSLLTTGDLLISIRGHVGRLALVPEELDGANITQDSARLTVVPESRHYVLGALRSPTMQRWMKKRIKGVAVQGINLGDLKRLPLPVPPLELQIRFAERFKAQMRVRATQAGSMMMLHDLIASLQQRAFAGEL